MFEKFKQRHNGLTLYPMEFVVQVAIVVIALSGALGLRVYNWRITRSEPGSRAERQSQRE